MLVWLRVILPGILYRVPRGGGLGDGRSTLAALIWATASGIANALWLQHWIPLVLIPLLMLGEAPGWSNWWPNNEEKIRNYWLRMGALSLRGCLLLNPLMGPIYFGFYAKRDILRPIGKFLAGWTEYSELASGIVTAAAYSWACSYLVGASHGILPVY